MAKAKKSFTLIELLISLAIVAMIVGVMYFSLRSALDSWQEARIQLSIQKVLNEVMRKIIGDKVSLGIMDTMELVSTSSDSVEFVVPWIDDTHTVTATGAVYVLNQKIKPGSAIPIAEVIMPQAKQKEIVPVLVLAQEDSSSDSSRVQLGLDLPIGSKLFFTFQPEIDNPAVINKIWWDAKTGEVFIRSFKGQEQLADLPLGVKITKLEFKYYDNTNSVVSDDSGKVEKDMLDSVTGIEIVLEAELNGNKGTIMSFVNLRNSPRHSGYISLHKGSKLNVPDSRQIKTFFLNQFSQVKTGDEFVMDLIPEKGITWRVKMKFTTTGSKIPVIDSFSVEYPPGNLVYSEYPRREANLGFDLLAFGTNGMYDYDLDQDAENKVVLDGKITLEVVKMDMEAVGAFIRP